MLFRSQHTQVDHESSPVVILGGYSYGSLILQHLPPVPSILQPFAAPVDGSAASEIILRARKLSDQRNLECINLVKEQERRSRKKHQARLPVTIGGEETSPERRRTSRELRTSMDGRRGADLGGRLRSLSHKRKRRDTLETPPGKSTAIPTIDMPQVRYLLISPLTTPFSVAVAPSLGARPWHRSPANQDVVGKHMTLAVYGNRDFFASAAKVRAWAERLKLTHVEVDGADHFWSDQSVVEKLKASLHEWESQICD